MIIEEKYTFEEFKSMHQDGKVLQIVEIKENIIKKIKLYKKFSLFIGLPLSIIFPYLNEFYFSQLAETSWKYSSIYHFLFMFDLFLFGASGVGILGLRNIVISVNYLTKEKKLELTKLTLQGKPYKCELQDPDHLMRWKRNFLNPFLSIQNKKTRECFSFHNLGEFIDKKLYYTVLPAKKHIARKDNSEDESMF